MILNFQSSTNHIFPTGERLGHRGFYLHPHRKVPMQFVFCFNVTRCDALMSEERVKACMDRLQTALKDIPGLDFRASWDIPKVTEDAPQDQAGVGESSRFDPE